MEELECIESLLIDGSGDMSDRQLAPRGTTPVNDVPDRLKFNIPINYRVGGLGRVSEEYLTLLSRGATRGMCIRYHLEFTNERGIVAWADEELYDAYAGPEMQDSDFWKIYLGRRIELAEEDKDGSEFINDLLEEVLLSPSNLDVPDGWETVEEQPGIWATGPFVSKNAEEGSESQSTEDSDGDEDESELTVNDWGYSYGQYMSGEYDVMKMRVSAMMSEYMSV